MFTPCHDLYNQGSVSVIISELQDSVNHQQLTWAKQPSIQAEETRLPYINITQSNQEKIMCGRGSQFQRLVTVPALTQMHRQMSDRQMTHPFINYSYMCNSLLRRNSHMFTEHFRGLSHIHRLCKHSRYHFWKILIAPRRNPMPISTHFSLFDPQLSHPSPRWPWLYFLLYVQDLPNPDICYKLNYPIRGLSGLTLPCSMVSSRSDQDVAHACGPFDRTPQYGHATLQLSAHPCCWATLGSFVVFGYYE